MEETWVIHQIPNTPMITPTINLTESLTYFYTLFLHVLVWGERLRFTYVENRIPYMVKKKEDQSQSKQTKNPLHFKRITLFSSLKALVLGSYTITVVLTFLRLQSFNTVLHVVVIPNYKITATL